MNQPLRVLHFTTVGASVGGAEQILVSLARFADRTRWDLAFCTMTPAGLVNDLLAAQGWPVHALDVAGLATLPHGLHRLHGLLAEFRPHVFHVHLSHATILGSLAAYLNPETVLVQTRHYTDYVARFRPRRAPLEAWAARRCTRIIAVSEATRAHLVANEGVAGSRVRVVENGVDWDDLAALDHADGRARLDAAGIPRGPTIGCAASFCVRKGHVHLLEAMAQVHARRPDAHLVLLGQGAQEGAARAAAERLGISRHVHFLGQREDARPLIAGVDVYVQPSIEEAFGLAVIEAMAMRRPVVASAVGGMLETVEHGRTGLHVPPAHPKALADAILAIIEDRERATAFGSEGSEIVRTRYSLQRLLDAYDDVYRDALSDRRDLASGARLGDPLAR